MISNYKKVFPLLLILVPVATLAYAKQEVCNSPSALDFNSCIKLSTRYHQCVWCKSIVYVVHDESLSFCTSAHSATVNILNGMECITKQKMKAYVDSNSSIAIENDNSAGRKRNNSHDSNLGDAKILTIPNTRGLNHEYSLTPEDFCKTLSRSSYNGHLYGSADEYNGWNWDSAQAHALSLPSCCGDAKAHLVTVGDSIEHDFVQHVSRGQSSWIGLRDVITEGSFEWIDGTPYDLNLFDGWAAGEPDNLDPARLNADCVVMNYNGGWSVINCDRIMQFFVFEYDCDVCTSLTTNQNNQHLYGIQSKSLTWNGAQSDVQSLPMCCSKTAHLVTIQDSSENAVVERVASESKQNAWLGLNDITTEGNFTWVDNTPFTFSDWKIGEPNNAGGNEDCVQTQNTVSFLGSQWYWNDVNCNDVQPSYMLEYDCDFCTTLIKNNNNQNLYGSKSGSLTWSSAQSDVQSLPNCCGMTAQLVTIEKSSENAMIESIAQRFGMSAWIGLSDITQEGNFTWLDGTPFSFNNWNSGEPNNSGGNEDCVQMQKIGSEWIWNDVNCNDTQPSYIFEYNCGGFCSTLTRNRKNQHLYGSQLGSFTWSSALSDLQSLPMCCGTTPHLATVQNFIENEIIDVLADRSRKYAWIGLHDITKEGNFTWVDNTTFSFNNWNNGEPNNSGGNEDCVQIRKIGSVWKWNDQNCNDVQPSYIFEYDCDFCATLTVNQKNQHLYGIQPVSLSWNDAQSDVLSLPICCGKAAHLVTIEDAAENTVVKSIINGSSSLFWTGLHDLADEGTFKWVDGTPLSFNDWANGEPSNAGGEENCVAIQLYGTIRAWNDAHCKNRLGGYIFEYDCPTTKPTKTPVPPTKIPMLPSNKPILPSKKPVLPTEMPIVPTKTPVVPTKTPVMPTKQPVLPTKFPVLPTNTPVVPSKTPITNTPVVPSKTPITNTPVLPTKKPVLPTQIPVRPTKMPRKKPVRPTKKPVRPTKKPVR